jgi:hypothetical protein
MGQFRSPDISPESSSSSSVLVFSDMHEPAQPFALSSDISLEGGRSMLEPRLLSSNQPYGPTIGIEGATQGDGKGYAESSFYFVNKSQSPTLEIDRTIVAGGSEVKKNNFALGTGALGQDPIERVTRDEQGSFSFSVPHAFSLPQWSSSKPTYSSVDQAGGGDSTSVLQWGSPIEAPNKGSSFQDSRALSARREGDEGRSASPLILPMDGSLLQPGQSSEGGLREDGGSGEGGFDGVTFTMSQMSHPRNPHGPGLTNQHLAPQEARRESQPAGSQVAGGRVSDKLRGGGDVDSNSESSNRFSHPPFSPKDPPVAGVHRQTPQSPKNGPIGLGSR